METQYQNTLVLNNGETTIFNELKQNLENCIEFQFNVAFVNYGGLQLFLNTFKELEARNIKGKIITSTYLNFSDPKALSRLNQISNIDFRIFSDVRKRGFHSKAYIFEFHNYYKVIIGSANLTASALKSNIEWNVQSLSKKDDKFVVEVLKEYHDTWNELDEVSDEFLASYEQFIKNLKNRSKERVEEFHYNRVLQPNSMQLEAMHSLQKLREHHEKRALVVAATGTGKTYMSAFDVKKVNPKKMLFLVHRGDILEKAEFSFNQVFGNTIHTGFFTGTRKDSEANYLFSTIATMNNHFKTFDKNEFDYIIVDEAHHATSPSYQKMLDYFEPKFLLGMTATPERSDGGDIFELFDNNVALEVRLQEAMQEELVVPFHYFGITDIDKADISNIKSDDIAALSKALKINERVDYIIEQMKFYGHDGPFCKCLGFCVSVDHAQYMSEQFNQRGIPSLMLNGDDSIADRTLAIQRLEDDHDPLQVIFTVDIFNEGIDIPTINLVLMLRPTNSPIVFIQQLGRGLRKNLNKEFLTVLDFIGNHNRAFLIAIALKGGRYYDKDSLKVAVKKDFINIPGDSFVQMDRVLKIRILDQLEHENFRTMKYLKEEYFEFKTMNRGKIPYNLMDFLKYEGAPDPLKFIKYAGTYPQFLAKFEKNDYLIKLTNDSEFMKVVKYVTDMLPIKRPNEFAILKYLMNHEHATMEQCQFIVSQYMNEPTMESIGHACNILNFEYYDASQHRRWNQLVSYLDQTVSCTDIFISLKKSSNYAHVIGDILNFGLCTYQKEFGSENYGFPFLKCYATYNMYDVALLTNLKKKVSSFRGSGLLTEKNEYFLFVELHKDADVKDSINYKDKFISRDVFQWESPNSTIQESKRGQNIIYNQQNEINLHLFVRKFSEVDGMVQPYIYMGKMNTFYFEGNKPIMIHAKLEHPVPTETYQELNEIG